MHIQSSTGKKKFTCTVVLLTLMILCREHCGTGIGHFLLVLGVIGVCKMLMYSLMTYLGLICIMALYDTH